MGGQYSWGGVRVGDVGMDDQIGGAGHGNRKEEGGGGRNRNRNRHRNRIRKHFSGTYIA